MNAVNRLGLGDSASRERGAILLLALVFMLMLAIIVSSVLQTSLLQLHMAGNDQFMEQASNSAQAMTSELSLDADNFQLGTAVGQSNCARDVADSDCVFNLLNVTAPDLPQGAVLDYRITRQAPLVYSGFPVRESEHSASSSNSFDAAMFEIDVRINGAQNKLGSSHVVQGIAMRIPATR